MKTLRRIAKLFGVSAVIALILCEVGLRIAVAQVPPPPTNDNRLADRLSGTMPQYANSPYWSPVFVHSVYDAIGSYELNEDDQLSAPDLTLPGFTIRDNQRVTTDQPATYTRTVWVFGSSTVWGVFVADGWTISSYLQREFNAQGLPWRVINMGQPGANITIEYYWLTKSDIRPGDIVIFLDGSVDLNNIIADSHKAQMADNLTCQLADRIPLAMITLLCDEATAGRAPSQYITPMMDEYRQRVDKATQYAQSRGAQYLHVMQPAMPHDGDLYAAMSRGDIVLAIQPADYFDELHYDDAGHAATAAQIAARFGAF